jgi:hypothetical protein
MSTTGNGTGTCTRDKIVELLARHKQRQEDPSWWNEQIIGADLGLSITQVPDPTENKLADGQAENNTTQTSVIPKRRQDVATKGFTEIDDVPSKELISKLQLGIIRLEQQKLPATFIFLFDEAWHLAAYSRNIMSQACHPKNKFNFDVLAWYIPPGEAGFSPHRDRQPDDASSTFHNDPEQREFENEPKFVTQWIALSDATPQNSCLYVIPKDCDPGYLKGDDGDQDPLHVAMPNKTSFQHIRAIPRQSGQSLLFTHRLIHWGSQSEGDHSDPRIAISFVCSDPAYESPFVNHDFSTDTSSLPPFHIRLLLVCAQLICYHQRFEPSKATIKSCYDYCKEFEEHLGEAFRQKVFLEFVKAMEEKTRPSSHTGIPKSEEQHSATGLAMDTLKNKDDDDDDDDENQDAMMEEMLNAENEGYGEFEDDFDATNDEEKEGEGEDVESNNNEDSVSDDEEEEVTIFGKRALEFKDSSLSKKIKRVMENNDDI